MPVIGCHVREFHVTGCHVIGCQKQGFRMRRMTWRAMSARPYLGGSDCGGELRRRRRQCRRRRREFGGRSCGTPAPPRSPRPRSRPSLPPSPPPLAASTPARGAHTCPPAPPPRYSACAGSPPTRARQMFLSPRHRRPCNSRNSKCNECRRRGGQCAISTSAIPCRSRRWAPMLPRPRPSHGHARGAAAE